MNKRLRKKYRVGEFSELCFSFSFEYKGDVESPACEEFLRSLIEDCIEAQSLDCEGHLTEDACVITVCAIDPKATNQEQLDSVKTWLEAREDVEIKAFSPLMDRWYGV